jgi:hypothetical protein
MKRIALIGGLVLSLGGISLARAELPQAGIQSDLAVTQSEVASPQQFRVVGRCDRRILNCLKRCRQIVCVRAPCTVQDHCIERCYRIHCE